MVFFEDPELLNFPAGKFDQMQLLLRISLHYKDLKSTVSWMALEDSEGSKYVTVF